MKNIILILGVLFYSAIASAQYTETDLEGGKWVLTKESNIAAMLDITMSFKNGIKSSISKLKSSPQDTTTIYIEKLECRYYLSEIQEDVFNSNKQNKGNKGNFIIVQNSKETYQTSVYRIESLSKTKLILQPLRKKGEIYIGANPSLEFYIKSSL